jgi:hypothetical protein
MHGFTLIDRKAPAGQTTAVCLQYETLFMTPIWLQNPEAAPTG